MKTTPIGRLALLILASGGLVAATVYAIETHLDGKAAPQISVDTRPVNRNATLPASFAGVIRDITPSVVKVEVTAKSKLAADLDGFEEFGPFGGMDLRRFFRGRGGPQAPAEHGAASGVIVSPDGYLLTNHHVIDRAEKVQVTLHDGRSLKAEVVGDDPKTDLAVLKVNASHLPAITFADSTELEVGDVVLAVGNPFGLGQSVTMGMVSATGRASLGLDYEDFIQTDAAINPGNSGGALVDVQGRLVGINTAIVSRGGGNDGIGFAIPSNMARDVMNDLITCGAVNRPTLGVAIQDLTPALARQFGAEETTHGALVGDVVPHSPAAKAGLKDGDIITSFGGHAVKDARELKLAVVTHKPGEEVEMQILRDGADKTLSAKLEAQSDDKLQAAADHGAAAPGDEGTLNGVGVADLDGAVRRQAQIPADVKGALVTEVEGDSPAWDAGLRPGDVIEQINRKPVHDAADAVRMTESQSAKETLLRVWSHGASRYLTVEEGPAIG